MLRKVLIKTSLIKINCHCTIYSTRAPTQAWEMIVHKGIRLVHCKTIYIYIYILCTYIITIIALYVMLLVHCKNKKYPPLYYNVLYKYCILVLTLKLRSRINLGLRFYSSVGPRIYTG